MTGVGPQSAANLLNWYLASARDLPWRRTRDPWSIWVSEVMLQQTRVEVVIPYYERFLRSFPDPGALARADEESALAHWSGLGYYTRCRNLRRGARTVEERHGGRFPETLDEALEIPGVGPYTAAAILSIAYGKPLPVVDGNVARLLARLLMLDPPGGRARRVLEAGARDLLVQGSAGESNQAMMELGATICLPRAPRCGGCPLAGSCRALAADRVLLYPVQRPRRQSVEVTGTVYLARDSSGRLLLERGAFSLLPHLWLPPIRVGRPKEPGSLGTLRHSITHHRIRLAVQRGAPPGGRVACERRWLGPLELVEVGRSSLVTKVLRLEERAGSD